jgi:hypothetical protein
MDPSGGGIVAPQDADGLDSIAHDLLELLDGRWGHYLGQAREANQRQQNRTTNHAQHNSVPRQSKRLRGT